MIKTQQKQVPYFFLNLKKEINGKKYQYAGEYPNKKSFINKMRKLMDQNGYHIWIDYKTKNNDGKILLWSRKKKV